MKTNINQELTTKVPVSVDGKTGLRTWLQVEKDLKAGKNVLAGLPGTRVVKLRMLYRNLHEQD